MGAAPPPKPYRHQPSPNLWHRPSASSPSRLLLPPTHPHRAASSNLRRPPRSSSRRGRTTKFDPAGGTNSSTTTSGALVQVPPGAVRRTSSRSRARSGRPRRNHPSLPNLPLVRRSCSRRGRRQASVALYCTGTGTPVHTDTLQDHLIIHCCSACGVPAVRGVVTIVFCGRHGL